MIEKIKASLNILDLVKRLGIVPNRNNKIHTIYKSENTPSLQLYPDTNMFKCYATGRAGDLIDFYMDYYNISKGQAIKELSEMLGLNDNFNFREGKKEFPVIPDKPKTYNLLDSEKEFFEERSAVIEYEGNYTRESADLLAFRCILLIRKSIQIKVYEALKNYCLNSGWNEKAYLYLTGEKRGLSADTINKFKLFSIKSQSETVEFLRSKFTQDELIISGLFKNDYFIFTRHRIIIPYLENGIIVYLRGRYWYNDSPIPSDMGKYIGLSNFSTNLTAKRFYNPDILQIIKPFQDLYISEGEFDCMILNQSGYNAIGIPGVSNFPKEAIPEIENYNIILALDSDEAGQKAALEIAQYFNKPIKSIKLKVHKDITELFSNESK